MEMNGFRFVSSVEWPTIPLHQPRMLTIINALTTGLQRYFEDVKIKDTKCPKLAEEPFHLAGNGLHGCETIIGCFTNIDETLQANVTPKWDLKEIVMELCNDVFLIGGGYAETPTLPFNGTLIMNATYSAPDQINNESCVVFKDSNIGRIRMETLTHPDHMICSMRGNFFMSEGIEERRVIELHVKKRRSNSRLGHINIINLIRNILIRANLDSDYDIGLGGILMVKKGSVTHQVLPDNTEINRLVTPYALSGFYEYIDSQINGEPYLVSLGTIVVHSLANLSQLNDMPHNFYTFSNDENGGLFFNDILSNDIEDIEYVGYFNIAKALYVPKPNINTMEPQ